MYLTFREVSFSGSLPLPVSCVLPLEIALSWLWQKPDLFSNVQFLHLLTECAPCIVQFAVRAVRSSLSLQRQSSYQVVAKAQPIFKLPFVHLFTECASGTYGAFNDAMLDCG